MTRAAIYIRVSTARQAEEGFSLDEQERRALAHIERAGWEHAGTYREEGVSGAKQHRPQLDRLLADLPGLGAVVVPSLDRLGRSTRHLLELYERLEAADVVLVSLRESLDTSTSVGRLIRTVLSAVAEFERDIGRERTSAGIAGRARKEAKPWGVPGLGYTRGEGGRWAIEPAEAEIVRRIYLENVRHGLSFAGIARLLNGESVPTRRGSRWAPNVIRRVLSSRHVLGEFEHDGEWHMGRHDAIIDQATWDAAQVQAEAGRKYAPNGRAGPLPKRHLLIRGMGRCGLCGDALLPRTGPPEAYVCRRHKLDTSACLMPVLPRAAVETAMLDMFERTALSFAETQRHVAEQLEGRSSATRAQAERAADEALRMQKALDRAARDYAAGDLGAASFERLTAQWTTEATAAEAERDRLASHAAELEAAAVGIDAETEVLQCLAALRAAIAARVHEAGHDVNALRAAMTAVFSKVVVLPEACLLGRVDPQDWVPETPPRIEVVAGVRPEMVDDGDGNAFDVQRIGIAFDVPQGAKNGSSNTGLPG